MINLPYVSLPEYYTRLLVNNVQNSTKINTNLEIYISENKELNALIRRVFRDIDLGGFIGKILSISGWFGVRNRLAAVYLEHAMTGKFPEVANLELVTDLVVIENKLRHFTPPGFSRSFLLAFYAKMSFIQLASHNPTKAFTPLLIKDEHLDFMKLSKAKSVRIDWLILQLIQYGHFLGTERLNGLLSKETSYSALFSMLSKEEQRQMVANCLSYGASIYDTDIFIGDVSHV